MAYSRRDLDTAALHIRQGEARVRALEDNIEEFRKHGYDTTLAEATLSLFLDVLGSMREHEAAIREDIRAREAAERR